MSLDFVEARYTDAFGREQTIDPEVRRRVAEAMGPEPDAGRDPVAIVARGAALPIRGELVLEDGTALGSVRSMPADAPFGYHVLHRSDGGTTLLLTGPGRCHLPGDLRAWGWAVQLATTRSRRSWGIGDLRDLRALARWSAREGAGFLAVGPLGSPNPGPYPEPSPYYPSTRRWWNPLHLAVEEVPGFREAGPRAHELTAEGRRLNRERLVDRPRVAGLKMRALEAAWGVAAERDTFEAWRAEMGSSLERWATFSVISELDGPGWQGWPAALRRPSDAAVRKVATEHADRVAFHAWVQWCLDRQLRRVGAELPRIADMPVGVDPGGFDAWDWQDRLALDASIGAPPDRFNAAGQSWGLPPFVPHRLRGDGYRPFVETLRAQLRHAGGLRIDHVLGLFRQWWVPSGEDPSRGAYVRVPTAELLEIVAIESARAEAVVVGEDLGTVPPGVRRELRRRRLLSTRLVLFERVPPARYPRGAFAAVTTHDLPTVAGALGDADERDQAAAGIEPDAEAADILRRRLRSASGGGRRMPAERVSLELHRRLAASPSVLVAPTLEDALGVEERPNLPGTVAPQRANWSLALPPLEEALKNEGVSATAVVMTKGRRSRGT